MKSREIIDQIRQMLLVDMDGVEDATIVDMDGVEDAAIVITAEEGSKKFQITCELIDDEDDEDLEDEEDDDGE